MKLGHGHIYNKEWAASRIYATNPPIAHPLWPYMTYYDQQKAFSVIVKTEGSFAALIKSELGSQILWISFRHRRRAGNCSGLLRCIDIDKKPFWLLGLLAILASTLVTVFGIEFFNFYIILLNYC